MARLPRKRREVGSCGGWATRYPLLLVPTGDAIGSPRLTGAVVVDTTASRFARLRPVPMSAVWLQDAFWQPRREINRRRTLPSQHQQCEQTGRIDNFRRAAGKKEGPFQGIFFNDSDVYKWLEAAAWTLAGDEDPELRRLVDSTIDEIAAAQQPDGYLNTYFMFDKASQRWTNLKDMHELYCAGHLIQAAVAHHRATGDERLLNVARRFADLICATFGPVEQGKRLGACGHEEIEMALAELGRDTGEDRYLKQAQFFVDVRGRGAAGGQAYHQDHKPFRELDRMVGHAVRAVYLNCGAADVCTEMGDPALRMALDRLWDNMVHRQLYINGGIGSRHEGEAFGKDYELPNERAYTETCAAIGSIMWNWRMLLLSGEARFADLMELSLYNGVLSGLSLDGQSYFYQNPLADDGSHRRQAWFGCACCPPNIARLLASMPGYFYSVSKEGIWAHLYAQHEARVTLPGGRTVDLHQRTGYPWDGRISIEVKTARTFALMLRIPGWAQRGVQLKVNGRTTETSVLPGSYAAIRRDWKAGDVVELNLPMDARRVQCHPYAMENAGRVALMRGPLLYCVEEADNPGVDPRDVVLPAEAIFSEAFESELLGGVVVLRVNGRIEPPDAAWSGRLYRPAGEAVTSEGRAAEVTLIPYYAWANRTAGRMQVWLRT